MKVTYLGHSCLMVETKGKKILFDPFISGNELASNINPDDIKADVILLTHGHGDHVADTKRIAKNNNIQIVSNYEVVNWFENKGVKGHPLNHGGKKEFDFGTAKFVNAVHSSSLPDGTYGGNPGGFVFWNDEGCFYHSGDTALTMDMQLIPRTCPKLDFAILPIGDNFTMDYEDAVLAAEFVKCNTVIGCHYDTFGYIKIDHEAAKKAFSEKGIELILLSVGDSWNS